MICSRSRSWLGLSLSSSSGTSDSQSQVLPWGHDFCIISKAVPVGLGEEETTWRPQRINWRGGSLLVALCCVSWSLLGWETLLCGGAAWPAVTRGLCGWLRPSVLVKLKASLRVTWHSHIGFLLMSVLNHGDAYRIGPLTINIPPRGEITCNKCQTSIFTRNPKIPWPAGSHFVGAHFSQAEGLGLLVGANTQAPVVCITCCQPRATHTYPEPCPWTWIICQMDFSRRWKVKWRFFTSEWYHPSSHFLSNLWVCFHFQSHFGSPVQAPLLAQCIFQKSPFGVILNPYPCLSFILLWER